MLVGVVGELGSLTITVGTITKGAMVGYIGGSVEVPCVIDISGGGILIIAGGGRIGRPGGGAIFGKAGDEVGIMGTVMMRNLVRTSQTDHCVNIWPRHTLLLVTGAEDRVNRRLTTCWSFQA